MELKQLQQSLSQENSAIIEINDTEMILHHVAPEISVAENITTFPEFTRIQHADNRPGQLVERTDNSVVIQVANEFVQDTLLHVLVKTEAISQRRIHFEIGKNAQIRVILYQVSAGAYDEMLSVHVNENAKAEFTIVDNSEENLMRTFLREMTVERDARLNVAVAALSDGDTTSENFINLVGPNAQAESKLITVGSQEQVQLHRVQINNLAPFTSGDILNHGVMKEQARGEFYGVGFIQKGQNGSNNEQESRMMVIDREARADVHPILLIDEYDVIAGHAGSVGRVSEEALYYLMSRGMSKQEADRLITKGFLSPVLEHITEETVRNLIEELIERKI